MKWVIDQIVEAGTLFLLFTGGEILLRKDFTELYLYARSKGILVLCSPMAPFSPKR